MASRAIEEPLCGDGAGAAKLENISYAGRIGRLYNLLRRNVASDPNPTIDTATVRHICQLNNIDWPNREMGLNVLAAMGRIDVAGNGAVSILGATSRAVLEVTADIFADASPTTDEEAVLMAMGSSNPGQCSESLN